MVQVRQIQLGRLGWRKVAAGLPAIVLIGAGTALAAGTGSHLSGSDVAQGTGRFPHRISVPVDAAHEQATYLQSALAAPLPALALPTGMTALPAIGGVQGSSASNQSVVLDRAGIPAEALKAYHLAADLVGAADPSCHLDWAIPAAIGRVESNHARYGGNTLDSAGVAQPGIIGIPLDGAHGTTRIGDTDHGVWDHDTSYDRAVGPMQFIPGTWRSVGQDADGDGTANPQDINDAATAAAVYLCSGPGDLSQDADLYRAIYRYNQSDSYVKTVMNLAKAYRQGVTSLPLSQLPAATTAAPGSAPGDSGFGVPPGTVQAAGPTSSASHSSAPASGSPSSSSSSSASSRAPVVAAPAPSSTPGSMLPPVVAQPLRSASGAVSSAASSASSAASSAAAPVVTTLQRVSLGVTQVVGGLGALTGVLPPAPSDLTKVVKTNTPVTAAMGAACFTATGATVPLTGLPLYSAVACPADTR